MFNQFGLNPACDITPTADSCLTSGRKLSCEIDPTVKNCLMYTLLKFYDALTVSRLLEHFCEFIHKCEPSIMGMNPETLTPKKEKILDEIARQPKERMYHLGSLLLRAPDKNKGQDLIREALPSISEGCAPRRFKK